MHFLERCVHPLLLSTRCTSFCWGYVSLFKYQRQPAAESSRVDYCCCCCCCCWWPKKRRHSAAAAAAQICYIPIYMLNLRGKTLMLKELSPCLLTLLSFRYERAVVYLQQLINYTSDIVDPLHHSLAHVVQKSYLI